jgi:HK97 family phage prohead protease
MPKPNNGESKKDYISRCMGDSEMNSKHPDEKQRYAICQSFWQEKSNNDKKLEHKSINFELKDFSRESRSAVIAHAVYDNVDLVGDISVKGMFASSWNRKDPISFYFNHDATQTPGKVLRTFEDEQKAYTEVKFGNWTLGNDVMEMVDFGVIKGASFGYETEKKDYVQKGNRKIRKLLQVKHIETSLLTIPPANPLAGVVSLNKSMDFKTLSLGETEVLMKIAGNDLAVMESLINLAQGQDANSDIYIWIMDQISRRASYLSDVRYQLYFNTGLRKSLISHLNILEKFCNESKATDECIFTIQSQVDEIKKLLIDTGSTQLIIDGESSNESLLKKLLIFNQRLSIA